MSLLLRSTTTPRITTIVTMVMLVVINMHMPMWMVTRVVAQGSRLSCRSVSDALAPCASFLTNGSPTPNAANGCCNGVQQVAGLGTSQADRQAICRCLVSEGNNLNVSPSSISTLTSACHISFPFSIPQNTPIDCSRYTHFPNKL